MKEDKEKMASDLEPPLKRSKRMEESGLNLDQAIELMKSSSTNLTPIISDDFSIAVPYTEVWTAVIKNPKDISKTVLRLNEKFPIKELQHLKRVRNKEIIIASSQTHTCKDIQEYMNENLKDLTEVFEDYKIVNVPALPPKLKWQFEECNKVWPCNFHPNKYTERLFSGAFFDDKDLSMHRIFMAVAFETVRIQKSADIELNMLSETGATVVVDPKIESVVAVTFDRRHHHPLQHSAMLAIDNVARTQNGGAWNVNNYPPDLKGIDKDLYIKLKEKFPDLKFGSKEFASKEKDPNGPYLCTGYDVYTVSEPCVMCSMGLVHARVRRVFFCRPNLIDGALMTKAKLQTIASLNHHFEVFTGFL